MTFALGLTACSEQEIPTERRSTQSASADEAGGSQEKTELQRGQTLFDRMCATCHGSRGNERGTRKGPSLQRDEFTYGRNLESVMESIRDGRPNGMPFFHHALSDEELEVVARYVLSLGQ
ncbi:c-type cytochrome [Geoalkalibacter subterraneus]|uniref:c-type cytochrome n=1 Tax=Geoalkalibacter subterraneus TaxID=483547 RepID=UPI000694A9B3|nr:cytochrome c [Geoalkalibacter subterraneus]